jgi:drug/metabolite transporter (DMT)-like permease
MQKEHLYIIISALLFGLITAGAQFFSNLGLSLYEISVLSFFMEVLILVPIVLIKKEYAIKRKMVPFFIVYGLIGSFLQFTQYGGIVLGVPVAIVALLLYNQPIWSIIFGKIMLKEKITKIKFIAVIISFLGVIILIQPWNIASVGPIQGIIFALLGGIFLSLWVVYGRKSGINNQHYVTTAAGYAIFSAIWLFLFWPAASLFFHDLNIIRLNINILAKSWYYIFIFALAAHIIPHFFFYKGVQKIQASVAGIILLLEPISATILAAIFFAQSISLSTFFGGALILLSNYLIIHNKN